MDFPPPSGGRDAAECYALATLWISGAPGLFFWGQNGGGNVLCCGNVGLFFFGKYLERLEISGLSSFVVTKNMLDGDRFWTILFSFVRKKHK